MNKIKVVISGLIFPLTIMRYFWEAFERRTDVDLFVVGPFSGDWIPWTTIPGDSGGMRLPQRYIKTPNIFLPINSPIISSKMVEAQMRNWCDHPDLWLEIDANWHFSDRPNAEIVAHLQTDPHVLRGFYDQVRDKYDFTFCMQFFYMRPGDTYIPYAYAPTIHYPMEVEKEYDVCLIGLQYPQRTQLINRLKSNGLKVRYELGTIMDEYRLAYNQSRIGLNWSTLQDLNARFFEIPAMGLPMVANHVHDAEEFLIAGDDFLEFDTLEEAERNVMELLNDKKLREKIANNGHEKIKSETYDARVQTILEACGLVK